ncbi:hypothetical protein, partial [Rhizobium hidalgonense]|uniref:hypothetical protein n=1 Tax=Rhizobium hidalgonense TaxID=1538159 RepID=UPI002870BB89
FLENERLRRQQRRRPRSVSGLIELTLPSSQQPFSKKLIFLSCYCFSRSIFSRGVNTVVSRIPTGPTPPRKRASFDFSREERSFASLRPDIITICWS